VGLRDVVGCDSALLAPAARPAILLGKEGFEHIFAQHVRTPHRYAPTLEALSRAALRTGGACVDVNVLSTHLRSRSLFYREVMAPQRIQSQIYAAARVRDRLVWTLFLCRHGRGRPLGEDVAAALSRVLPMLGAAQIAVEWADAAHHLDHLSPREREIAALVARGMRTSEIAAIFGTSPNTVRNQIVRIFAKAGVTTRAELAGLAAAAAGRPQGLG
jgi:DNA-binding CsgD family transcriptional regulator